MTGNAPREVAILVAENTGKVQALMKLIHNGYRDPVLNEKVDDDVLAAPQIIDTVHFAAKMDTPLLQLADVVAFLVKRRFQQKSDTRSFYIQLEPHRSAGAARQSAPLGARRPLSAMRSGAERVQNAG